MSDLLANGPLSSGIGSWPGEELGEALRIAFAECPDLPYLPELPARGVGAGMIGRATALLAGLSVDLQPAGWRLTDGSGHDHRRAISWLRSDLDQLEEEAQGYQGWFKIAVAGPWTLAASMERPRGDRVLADHGARREVAESLAEGLAELFAELSRRLPELRWVLQLDEPLLPVVLAGGVPTASGFSKHRAVEEPEAAQALGGLLNRVRSAVPELPGIVHCCAADAPIALLRGAGYQGVFLDLGLVSTEQWDVIGEQLEQGMWLGTGVASPGSPADQLPTPDQLAARVLGPIRKLGIDPEVARRLVLTPTCGLAGAAPAVAPKILHALRSAAQIVGEELSE